MAPIPDLRCPASGSGWNLASFRWWCDQAIGGSACQFHAILWCDGRRIDRRLDDFKVRGQIALLVALTTFGLSGSAGYVIDKTWLLICSRAMLGLAVCPHYAGWPVQSGAPRPGFCHESALFRRRDRSDNPGSDVVVLEPADHVSADGRHYRNVAMRGCDPLAPHGVMNRSFCS